LLLTFMPNTFRLSFTAKPCCSTSSTFLFSGPMQSMLVFSTLHARPDSLSKLVRFTFSLASELPSRLHKMLQSSAKVYTFLACGLTFFFC
jgi:hypothetical protein